MDWSKAQVDRRTATLRLDDTSRKMLYIFRQKKLRQTWERATYERLLKACPTLLDWSNLPDDRRPWGVVGRSRPIQKDLRFSIDACVNWNGPKSQIPRLASQWPPTADDVTYVGFTHMIVGQSKAHSFEPYKARRDGALLILFGCRLLDEDQYLDLLGPTDCKAAAAGEFRHSSLCKETFCINPFDQIITRAERKWVRPTHKEKEEASAQIVRNTWGIPDVYKERDSQLVEQEVAKKEKASSKKMQVYKKVMKCPWEECDMRFKAREDLRAHLLADHAHGDRDLINQTVPMQWSGLGDMKQ